MGAQSERLILGAVLVISLIALFLQALVLRPRLWPAGPGLALSGDTVFARLAAPRPIAVIRPPEVADIATTPAAVVAVFPGGPADRAGISTATSDLRIELESTTVDLQPKTAEQALQAWRALQTSAGRIGDVAIDQPPIWAAPNPPWGAWLRVHLGPIVQMAAFLSGAAVLLLLGTHGTTATFATLALIATAAANSGPLMGSDRALPVLDDARVTGTAHRAAIVAGLAAGPPEVRVLALRAAGRTMREEFLTDAVSALRDPSIDVRREAAFAVAQIGNAPATLGPATTALLEALASERDVLVFASLAENLGRLPFADVAGVDRAALAVRAGLDRLSPGGAPTFATLGAARGAEALARRTVRLKAASPALSAWLEALCAGAAAATGQSRPDPLATRVRRLGLGGLLALDAVGTARTAAALDDADAQVRRLGVLALARLPVLPADAGAAQLKDPAFLVRHAVVSRLGPKRPALATAALDDPQLNVRLAALDALGQAAACRDACAVRLDPARAPDAWHEPAHAVVALARTTPEEARVHVARLARTPEPWWQLRMYAARAAGLTKQADVLRTLAADANVNVRHAALSTWRGAGAPGLTDAARQALDSDDGQLLIEAAAALEGASAHDDTVTALRGALERLTRARRDTSRDPRIALLERIDELDPDRATTLRRWLEDADPVVAERAAALINARLAPGAVRVTASPSTGAVAGWPHVRVPAWPEVRTLDASTVTLTLRGGRTLTMRLYAQVAPTAVARLVDQVRAGEWNGRTLHRVEPGFVVQGGSPAANEYAGAAAYTRDEFSSLSNVRGTVGISTRGPDTGDGQIYVNLVDNVRLDFAFTLIGSIGGDLTGLDDLVEGEEIVSATVASAR
jgi:cyclophilin family peptidyl-prolyl cis-trans isomerase